MQNNHSTLQSAAGTDAASMAGYPIKTNFQRQVYCILGLPFDAVTLEQAVAEVADAARGNRRCFFSTPNLNFVAASLSGGDFRDSVIRSDLSVADGMPLVWIARLLGLPIRQRVAGSTVFETLRNKRGAALSVYFFGGPDGVAETAAAKLNATRSGLQCVGYQSPGFDSVENMSGAAVIDPINASNADFLVVALGAKKGQAWIEHNLSRLQAPVISHLGAVVNFVAGSVTRAPAWVGQIGCEWLWRIKEEPALWQRYLRDGLTLSRLLVTRVLPCALMRLRKRDVHAVAAAKVSLSTHENNCTITPSGAWEHSNLTPLREAFRSATASPSSIQLDFAGVTQIDSAGIALLMLLYGHQSKIDHRFVLRNVRPDVKRALRMHCADYLVRRAADEERPAAANVVLR